jgi:diguanylate cyclase (GGDEF)-like protein
MNRFFMLLYLCWARLINEATRDTLTGLLNRRGFNEALQQQGAIATRYARPLSLLLIDLRNLKIYNASEGYEAGDRILQETARILTHQSRAADAVCRIGGDEFALLLPETELSAARTIEARLRRALHATGIDIHSGLSSGEPDHLLAQADEALRENKREHVKLH